MKRASLLGVRDLRLDALDGLLERRRGWIERGARAYAYGQALVLGLAGILTLGGGEATVLHAVSSSADVAAWRSPLPGAAGTLVTLAAAVSVLGALRLASWPERLAAGLGHAVLLGAVNAARASSVEPDAMFLLASLASFAGVACQGLVSWRAWRERRVVPADVPPLAPAPPDEPPPPPFA